MARPATKEEVSEDDMKRAQDAKKATGLAAIFFLKFRYGDNAIQQIAFNDETGQRVTAYTEVQLKEGDLFVCSKEGEIVNATPFEVLMIRKMLKA